MDQTFMKEKPVMPLVISMALPMTISMLVNALYNIVDSYFVAKISEDSMTALSLVYPMQNLITAVTVGFAIGVNAIIAFYLGAKKSEAANQAASMGMLFNIIHGILLNIGCIAVMPAFLRIFTKDSNILKMGLDYSNIVFMFTIPISISISFEKIFQSVGNMKVSMICMILGCVTNIILDPLFIFGIGFIPELGIKGAAIATCIGQLVTLSGYIIAYFVRPIPAKIRIEYMKFDSTLCKKMYAIGIPATLNLALPSIQISALNGILSAYSAGYVLVLGSYYKLQTFLYLTVNGVVQGMRPLIGYNYGAGEKKRVRDIFKSALILIVGVMVIGTILCLIIPDKLIGLFTNKANTIEIGKTALRIISLGFIVSSVPVAVSGALEGLGKGKESLVISILRYIVIMISLAFFISRIVGATGVWHAFWITEVFMAVISGVICKKQILK
ncbi:MATE family efflux transporter [Bovifimicola ammoniilytica]|jgi:putative MATE family efflux protein|uniref:MATE family efflux transporter n=1 Tax=Bovifimicola ammoniilytica TaxID=2981720 RepID=UPI0008203B57|nr:MATE family efflux transporter [Bovifimicola ammoniilytica]MCU6752312.1 MATE family efflux transporter [Bovifimicola ammoniilytica]SCJ15967.1 Multidrug export protein mepA [uncultured Eubacterium sp.]